MLARHWGRPFLGVDRKSPKSVQRSDRLPPSLESDFCLVFMAIPRGTTAASPAAWSMSASTLD